MTQDRKGWFRSILRRDRRGSVAIEFAMIAGPFLLITFAIIGFGYYYWIAHQLNYLCSQASHYVFDNSGKNLNWVSTIESYLDTCVADGDCNPYLNATPGITAGSFSRTVTVSGTSPTLVDMVLNYDDFPFLQVVYQLAGMGTQQPITISVHCVAPGY